VPHLRQRISPSSIRFSIPGKGGGGNWVSEVSRWMSRQVRTSCTPARQDRTIVGQHARGVDGPEGEVIGISPWGYPVVGVVIVAAAGEFRLGWALSLSAIVTALVWLVLRKRQPDSVAPMGLTIRPLALAIIRRGDALLVFEGRDDVKDETFYRPLGGGVEFGENSKDALKREFGEELGAEIDVGRRLEVLENVFTLQDRPGHEIAFLYEAAFVDPSFYERDEMKILDEPATACWVDVADFRDGSKILYPKRLIDFLSPEQGTGSR
jgi:8-oxo-dGTP pyrophosphatase MutT (NUDIX family)